MNNILLLVVVFLLISCKPNSTNKHVEERNISFVDVQARLGAGHLKRVKDFPSEYIETRNVDVWLPNEFDPRKEHAIIYMHDGQMLFDSTNTWNKQEWMIDETVQSLMDTKKIPSTIVIGIWNISERRSSDYFPQKAFEKIDSLKQKELLTRALKNNSSLATKGFAADAYLNFIVKELKPFIEDQFNIKKDIKYSAVIGSSMGGLISMYAICEYPEVFGAAGCISTHWPGVNPSDDKTISEAILSYFVGNAPNPENHKLYFDYGDQTLDSFYLPYGDHIDLILKEAGYNELNSMNKLFPGEDHSERSWQKRMDVPIGFLLGSNS